MLAVIPSLYFWIFHPASIQNSYLNYTMFYYSTENFIPQTIHHPTAIVTTVYAAESIILGAQGPSSRYSALDSRKPATERLNTHHSMSSLGYLVYMNLPSCWTYPCSLRTELNWTLLPAAPCRCGDITGGGVVCGTVRVRRIQTRIMICRIIIRHIMISHCNGRNNAIIGCHFSMH